MLKNTHVVCCVLLLLYGCSTQQQHSKIDSIEQNTVKAFTFQPSVLYADGFSISVFPSYKHVVVFDPWQGDTMATYTLYPKGEEKPDSAPISDFYIPVPIDEIASISSTHIGFLELLGELDKVIGISNSGRIYNEYLTQKDKKGELMEIGRNMGSNLEHILALSPELLMKTGHDNIRDADTRIVDAGIPIAYNIEWMESSLLGRAEWIKYVATFFNKDAMADSLFTGIEQRYLHILNEVKQMGNKPTVVSGNDFKGTWHMPGGNSYVARMFMDAGGDYHYKSESSKGNIPLSFETVLENMVDADVWIGVHANSLHEIEMMDERYTLFKAFQEGRVYSIRGRVRESGANDYWESGIARPDILLKDLISIMHPELLPEHKLVYFKKLDKGPI